LDFDLIVALGGGSVIDTAKAIAAMRAVGSPDWIEKHLKDRLPFPAEFQPEPIIAVPTTFAGSQVTMWATIWDMDEKKKYSVSHPSLYPEKTILDPDPMLSLPRKETIYSALDALSHAMEAVWNKNHNPVSDTLALKAISLIVAYLPRLQSKPADLNIFTALLKASLFSSLAFSNTKTALAHSISYTLTANYGLPHGLACSLTLPSLLEFNGTRRFDRIKQMAAALDSEVDIHAMVKNLKGLFRDINVSLCLADHGISREDVEIIVDSAITPERADNNIVDIGKDDLSFLIKSLF
jgi:phosphonate metabolism-associated iron-containing alcohol dehydrogenase